MASRKAFLCLFFPLKESIKNPESATYLALKKKFGIMPKASKNAVKGGKKCREKLKKQQKRKQ